MQVSGFSFIRNGVQLDYPFIESVCSVLSLCDEFVILVGKSNDQTKQKLEAIGSPKIKIIDSIWDDSLREGGKVLAAETNKAFEKISGRSDWAFYLQADEVIHEKDLDAIYKAMKNFLPHPHVDGLLLNYIHFYGSYDYVANSRNWYRKEIRIIRNDKKISSFRDAQGFRKDGKKLRVKQIEAEVYHYGWVKHPDLQQLKQAQFHKFWHDDEWMQKNILQNKTFDYSRIESVARFSGTHPKIMQPRIEAKNWNLHLNADQNRLTFRNRFLQWIESKTGYRIGEYKNYKLI